MYGLTIQFQLVLNCANRPESYEIGGIFAEVEGDTVELSVSQRIWGLIVDFINVIVGSIAYDPFNLIENATKKLSNQSSETSI